MARYLDEAGDDKGLAFRLYRWNAQLCESLYVPAQFVEVGTRNCIARALDQRFTPLWPLMWNSRHLSAMPQGGRQKVKDAASNLTRSRKVLFVTADQVIASMTFGFWCKMLEKDYDGVLWSKGLKPFFPNIPANLPIRDFENRMKSLRDFRNKLAHYEPIYHHRPNRMYQDMLEIISWVCPDTYEVVRYMNDFQLTLAARPKK